MGVFSEGEILWVQNRVGIDDENLQVVIADGALIDAASQPSTGRADRRGLTLVHNPVGAIDERLDPQALFESREDLIKLPARLGVLGLHDWNQGDLFWRVVLPLDLEQCLKKNVPVILTLQGHEDSVVIETVVRGLKPAPPIDLHVVQQLLSGFMSPELIQDKIADPDADDEKAKDLSPERIAWKIPEGRGKPEEQEGGEYMKF